MRKYYEPVITSFDYLGPASEEVLRTHYLKSKKYPGKRVCSEVRWRIFLRKMADKQRYNNAQCLDKVYHVFY